MSRFSAIFLALALAGPAAAQVPPAPVPAPAPLPPYAEYAALILSGPVVADVTIRDAARLDPRQTAGVPAGFARFYLTGDVGALIRSGDPIPARISWLADVPLDARGKPPKLSKTRVLLFARPVSGRPGELQLVTRDAQRTWTPGADARTRGIVREVLAADAPPTITGVGKAFHVAGSLPGEGETQVFLATADGRPVSLSVLSRPGMAKAWSVALGEIVDEAATAPPRDTLLWYRLACALPPRLPDTSVAGAELADADAARADYRFVIESLGGCGTPVSADAAPA